MCTFENNPKIKLPKEKKIVAYKVFGRNSTNEAPRSLRFSWFRLGRNKWRQQLSEGNQKGFQVFAKKKDAVIYVSSYSGYVICPVTIYTKNIVKVADDWSTMLGPPNHEKITGLKVYEVISFALWKKDWKKRLKT